MTDVHNLMTVGANISAPKFYQYFGRNYTATAP